MDLQLTFTNGAIAGSGNDDVGPFVIKGTYDLNNRECWWSKTYVGAHTVLYRGFREGKGIWGTWDIGILCHGGFHIWPKTANEGAENIEIAQVGEPVDAVGDTAVHEVPQLQKAATMPVPPARIE
jgi:hypothetical protein